ncbi:hypothetical protein HY250_02910 [Candidatus Azambacteria bacterium]|nr:hypothetical protein [Candidatus Azambacteria bacterium]MBI3685329.1 hypothetical protein [Candidatus Azambacteria bacterium]
MDKEETQEQEDRHAQGLRQARAQSSRAEAKAGEDAQTTTDDSSEEEEKEKTALNIMTLFDVAGDLLGWVPFLGGIVRVITGAGAVIQSFKLNIAVRVKAWVINGVMALIDILLSFVGLNILPTQTIGAAIIRMMAGNAKTIEKIGHDK